MTDIQHDSAETIESTEGLRAIYDQPTERAIGKQLNSLDEFCRAFISLSPFVCVATADANGQVDVSPRGDAPGFVHVIDSKTVVIPDRRGNNRLDTFRNVLENPSAGLIFFIPGFAETLRVNGAAAVVRDPDLCSAAAINGQTPKALLKVAAREVFFHCGKALIRSRLWDAEAQVPRDRLPGLGRMIAEQIAAKTGDNVDEAAAAAADAWVAEAYRTKLY